MKVTGLEYVSIDLNEQFKITGAVLLKEIERRKKLGLKRLKGNTVTV
jgi:hypothetical protein